jgi:Flp pilus assembly protein TadG
MSARLHFLGTSKAVALGLRSEDRASQIVEFALSVPLLVLFVVGIFDFTGALALKHKLANAAREGARVAAADPANDLSNTSAVPVSVSDAYQVVDNYLLSEKINDCGLQGTLPTASALTWTSPALTGCQNNTGLVLIINRGCVKQQALNLTPPVTMTLVGTCVTIVYPYVWQFTSVAGLFSRFTGPTNITTSAIAFNQN